MKLPEAKNFLRYTFVQKGRKDLNETLQIKFCTFVALYIVLSELRSNDTN